MSIFRVADWESLVQAAHTERPRLTPTAFSAFRDRDGYNSYDILAQKVDACLGDVTILDLGCGDGHLIPKILSRVSPASRVIGLDPAAAGLECAKTQISDPRAEFILSRADSIPLADQSVDLVLSHMALMLMKPIDPVVRELRRVIKPGAVIWSVVSGHEGFGFYAELRRLLSIFVDMHIPEYRQLRSEPFPLGGECQNREFTYQGGLKGVWDYIESLYFWRLFGPAVREELILEIKSLARGYQDPAGQIKMTIPLRFNRYRI